MSYVICGWLRFENALSWDRVRVLSFWIAEVALTERLSIQLGLNATAAGPLVADILDIRPGVLPDDQLPFAITNSPADVTAEDLISPFPDSKDETATNEARLRSNMGRLGRFLNSLWQIRELTRIEMYFSEGYDDVYDECGVTLQDFEDVATKRILTTFGPDAIERPFPKFVLTRPANPT